MRLATVEVHLVRLASAPPTTAAATPAQANAPMLCEPQEGWSPGLEGPAHGTPRGPRALGCHARDLLSLVF